MTQQLDPVSALTTAAGLLMAPVLAELFGTYSIILLAATTGAAWSLGRRMPKDADTMEPRESGLAYFLKLNATAVLLTVGLATLITQAWPSFTGINWMLAPIGLMVGGIGNDWPRVGRWLVGFLARRLDNQPGGGQ